MTEQELEAINEWFRAEAQYINDSDPGQGYPYFEDENENPDDESERRVNWEFWQDDIDEIAQRSLRLFRNQLVSGGLYNVSRYTDGSPIEELSLLTFLEEEAWPEEWKDNEMSPWGARFVFLMADGSRLHLTWSEPYFVGGEERTFSIFDQEDHLFNGIEIFTRVS